MRRCHVRPAGARLKTFGGRASGPGPLDELFKFTIAKFRGAVGRKLTSIECHDILCKIGEVVVVGGVRRSAMISLSDLEDDRMRSCKSGNWWEQNGHRALANNSAAYTSKPDIGQFLAEWTSLYNSHSGERGIFSREASKSQAAKNGRRDQNYDFGTNPCSEIINPLSTTIRPSIDAISRGVLPDAGMTFEIPKITAVPTVAIEPEGDAFSDTDQNAAFLSVSVQKYAGQQTFSVELLAVTCGRCDIFGNHDSFSRDWNALMGEVGMWG